MKSLETEEKNSTSLLFSFSSLLFLFSSLSLYSSSSGFQFFIYTYGVVAGTDTREARERAPLSLLLLLLLPSSSFFPPPSFLPQCPFSLTGGSASQSVPSLRMPHSRRSMCVRAASSHLDSVMGPSPSQSKRTASASARSSVSGTGAAPHCGGSSFAISTSPGARTPVFFLYVVVVGCLFGGKRGRERRKRRRVSFAGERL